METLWGKLTKREKELNMSKVGARDLSHAVKSMKTALEQSRLDGKAMKDKFISLQVRASSMPMPKYGGAGICAKFDASPRGEKFDEPFSR